MTVTIEPRVCPVCGKPRGYGQPDHSACARQKQQENAERNAKLAHQRDYRRKKNQQAYAEGSKKRWWPD